MKREPISDEEYERIEKKYCIVEVNNCGDPDIFPCWGVYKEAGFIEEERFKMAEFGQSDIKKLLDYCYINGYKLSAAVISKDKEKADLVREVFIKSFEERGVLMDYEHFDESMKYLYYLTCQTNDNDETES